MKRILGKSGIEASAMGLGCWAIGGPWTITRDTGETIPAGWGQVDDAESIKAIHTALDLGITLFDTAANYGCGHSERILGQALGSRRQDVVIATKFGHLVDEELKTIRGDDDAIIENVRQDCEHSLRRLNTDYIDIYQLHESRYAPDQAEMLLEVLEELVAEGKIRAYGWSTDFPDRAQIFAAGENCASIQFSLNIFQDNAEMRAVCEDFNVGGINKKPLNSGILTGKFKASSTFPADDMRHKLVFTEGLGAERLSQLDQIRDVMTANGHTLAQASLAYIWALDENMVPIPGFRNVEQVEENANALALGPLADEQVTKIQQLLDNGPHKV